MGPEYLEGGREYYEKYSKRAKLIRKLIKDGDTYFTEDGILIPKWCNQHLVYHTPEKLSEMLEKAFEQEASAPKDSKSWLPF